MACKYKYKGGEYNEQEFRAFVKNNFIPKVKQSGITPSIKGHAQFSTDKGIGWFRSDEKVNGGEFNTNMNNPLRGWDTIEGEKGFAKTEGGNPTKTRRILELQSDLFQKGRDIKSPDEIIQELQKSGKLEIKCS